MYMYVCLKANKHYFPFYQYIHMTTYKKENCAFLNRSDIVSNYISTRWQLIENLLEILEINTESPTLHSSQY